MFKWWWIDLYIKVEIPAASDAVQSLIESSAGASDHGWEVGWSLSSYSSGPQPWLNTLQEHVCGALFQSFLSVSLCLCLCMCVSWGIYLFLYALGNLSSRIEVQTISAHTWVHWYMLLMWDQLPELLNNL